MGIVSDVFVTNFSTLFLSLYSCLKHRFFHKSRAFDRLNKEDKFLIHCVFVLEEMLSVRLLNETFIQDKVKGI